MYKVLVVEDEWFIRNSLVTAVEWEKVECEIIADVEDGGEAIQVLQELEPDIVVSDIMMDDVNGLELCKYIKDNKPQIKVILITGYSNFEYAQQAIKYGVKDYILKPTDPEELLSAVKRITGEIENQRIRQREFARLQQIVEESIPSLQEKLIFELVDGRLVDDVEIKQKQEFLNINLKDYYLIVGEIDNYNDFLNSYDEKLRQVIRFMIKDIALEVINLYGSGFFIEKETNLFIMPVKVADAFEIAEVIQKRVMDITETSISMGISRLMKGADTAVIAFQQAMEALRYKFYIGTYSVVSFQDLKRTPVSEYTIPTSDINKIMDSVKTGNSVEALNRLEDIFDAAAKLKPENYNQIINVAIEINVLLQRILLNIEEGQSKGQKDIDYYLQISRSKTIGDVQSLLRNRILHITDLIRTGNQKHNESVTSRIIEYLQENYQEDIMLEDLANVVFMNPKYVCRLIKKETGKNFSDILLDIRIDKAKQLLTQEDLRTYEVAEKVGIKDSRYFSKVFKKYTGVTPTEYKQNISEEA